MIRHIIKFIEKSSNEMITAVVLDSILVAEEDRLMKSRGAHAFNSAVCATTRYVVKGIDTNKIYIIKPYQIKSVN